MNLYEIDSRLESAFEKAIDAETGEVLDEELLAEFEQLQMDRDQKIENIACFIKNLKADAAALKAEKNALDKRQKTAENKAESLSKYLGGYLNGQTYKSPKAAVSWRKSEAIQVDDIEQIPKEFLNVTVAPNKTDIKAAIKNGKEVPGATLVTNQNMVVK